MFFSDWANGQFFEWMWVVLGLFALIGIIELNKRRNLRKLAHKKVLPKITSTLSKRRRWLKIVLILSALALVIVGLAEPQALGKKVFVKSQGIDIAIAIDVSDSMLAQDIRPNRLEKAKLALQDFIDLTRQDRIGIVAFAGDAFVHVPITLDRKAVGLFLKAVSPELIPVAGTSLGRAVDTSLRLFDFDAEGEKVIILLTDGEDHELDLNSVIQSAKDKNVRVFTIGIGTSDGNTIPLAMRGRPPGVKRDLYGNVVVTRLDEKSLKAIASETGGAYFKLGSGFLEVKKIYRLIRQFEKQETGSGWVTEFDPQYQIPILLAFVLLILQMIFSERRKSAID